MRCVSFLLLAAVIIALCPSSESRCGGRGGGRRGHRRPSHGHRRPHFGLRRPISGHRRPGHHHVHKPSCGHHHHRPIHVHKPSCGHHHHKRPGIHIKPCHHIKPIIHGIGGILGGLFGGHKPRPRPRPTPATCGRPPPRPHPPPPPRPPPPPHVTLVITSVSSQNPGTILGGSQTFSCKAVPGGSYTYSFFHNGRRVQHGSKSTYVMERIDPSDAGNYQCRVTFKGKHHHYVSKIIVVVVNPIPVTTTLTPSNPSPVTGDSMTLVCHTTHYGSLTYIFFHNGRKVQSGGENRMFFRHLKSSQAGNYQCRVTSGGDHFDSNLYMLVIKVITVHPPTLNPTNPSTTMPAGLDQILTCVSPDNGDLLYTFLKDGEKVQSGRNNRLVLRDMSADDSAAYACFVTKSGYHSIHSNVYTLVVQITIERPTMTCSCTSSHVWVESSLTLTCGHVTAGSVFHFLKDGHELHGHGGPSNTFHISSLSASDAGIYTCTITMHGHTSKPSTAFPVQVMEKCNTPIDLMFLVDKSASIKPHQFKISKEFMQKMIAKFSVSPDVVRVGTVLFANGPHNGFCFDQYTSNSALHTAIGALSCRMCKKGKTATGAALQFARENSFTVRCGARPSAKKIVVVLTDGRSTEAKSYVQNQAEAMKMVADEVITVGVGKVKRSELEMIATKDEYVFTTSDFSELEGMLDNIATKTCEAGAAGSDYDYMGGEDWEVDDGNEGDWNDSNELDWDYDRK